MKKLILLSILLSSALHPAFCNEQTTPEQETKTEAEQPKEKEERSFFGAVLLYLPNRIFDAFDMARARVRVGPGLTVNARATKLAGAAVGTHASVFAGVPGPRKEPKMNLPLGFETFSGIDLSLLGMGVENDSQAGVKYGTSEVGAGLHVLLVGADAGIDPVEIGDFLLGFLAIDLQGDDL